MTVKRNTRRRLSRDIRKARQDKERSKSAMLRPDVDDGDDFVRADAWRDWRSIEEFRA